MNSLNLYLTLILITIISISCTKKEKPKIELKYNLSAEQNLITTNMTTNYLNPKIFFEISIKINKTTKKYNNLIKNAKENEVEKLLQELEEKIKNIYKMYNITEEAINNYSEKHYSELEKYLKEHPEIEKELR